MLQKEERERAKCAARSTGVHIFSMTQALVEAEISAGNKEQTTNVLYQWVRSLLRCSDKTKAPLCCSALCLHRTGLVSEMKSWNQLRWGAVRGSSIKALWDTRGTSSGCLSTRDCSGGGGTKQLQPFLHMLAQRQKCDISVHLDRPCAN